FKAAASQSTAVHREMHAALDPAVERFRELLAGKPDDAEEWRGRLQALRNLYCFLSQIIPYQDSDLERLYAFLRHLSPKLARRPSGATYQFDEQVRLEYYRLQKIGEGSISLTDEVPTPLYGPAELGSGVLRDPSVPLSQLIN